MIVSLTYLTMSNIFLAFSVLLNSNTVAHTMSIMAPPRDRNCSCRESHMLSLATRKSYSVSRNCLRLSVNGEVVYVHDQRGVIWRQLVGHVPVHVVPFLAVLVVAQLWFDEFVIDEPNGLDVLKCL